MRFEHAYAIILVARIFADVMKLVDVSDSKSDEVHPSCRFDSGHRQFFTLREVRRYDYEIHVYYLRLRL